MNVMLSCYKIATEEAKPKIASLENMSQGMSLHKQFLHLLGNIRFQLRLHIFILSPR